jgi:hypothetical protein
MSFLLIPVSPTPFGQKRFRSNLISGHSRCPLACLKRATPGHNRAILFGQISIRPRTPFWRRNDNSYQFLKKIDHASRDWSAVKAKVASDAAALKAGIEERKHDRTVARAENYAEMLEDEAAFAIDYAISSVEQAKLAVLDAIVGRADAERARAS